MKPKNLVKKIYLKLKIIYKINLQKLLITLSINRNKPLNKPTSIIIDITPNCVLHCRQCNLWKTKPEKQITFNEAKEIIDRLHKWIGKFYLFFTGGEPFLNHDLPKIIKYAESIGIVTHVNSNAFLINKKLAKEILESNLSSISISLDGAKASTHDYLRGTPGTYKKVINAIKLLKSNNHHKRPKIYLNTVIMRQNVSELSDLIKISKKEKTDGITFQCLLPTLASQESIDQLQKSSLWPNFSELETKIEKIIKSNSKNKNLLTDKESLKQIINYYYCPNSVNQNIICTAGINNFIIDRFGDAHLCFSFPKIGNIFESKPKDIWLSKTAQKQRNIIRNCKKTCKVIECNQINIERQIEVESRSF